MPFEQPQLKAGLFGRSPTLKPPKSTLAPAGPPPPKPPPGLRVEHRIGIQAPAEVIWEVISDLGAWEQWNPIYTKASGEIRIGSTLEVTLALPGEAVQQLKPVVQEWVPNEQLHWRLTMLGGMVKTTRFIEIEKLGEANCIISNGELIGGLLGPRLGRRMGPKLYRAFREMDEAMKARAEQLWAARRPKSRRTRSPR